MYLDSCILVKLFVREPDSDFFGKLTDGKNLSSSILAYTEVFAALLAKERNGGITADQRPAFREYIVRERVPNYTISERVTVGAVLPETGVTYYDVPQSFGMTPYRYTVVNGQTILVEPRSRRIVQVVD